MKKILDIVICIAALFIAYFSARFVTVERLLCGPQTPTTLAAAQEGYPGICIGTPAAADIPRIDTIAAWEETWETSYVTVEPTDVICTGIGGRHPWLTEYTQRTSRRVRTRRRPLTTNILLDYMGEYSEYCLIRLPDQSYILAQIPLEDIKKLKTGRDVTLPVGHRQSVSTQAQSALREISAKYDVSVESEFYCINDAWLESHHYLVFFVRFALGAAIFFVVAVGLITGIYKLLKLED